LAGSEKAASNVERLSEGKYINKSLLALGTVIEQLADKTRKTYVKAFSKERGYHS
jgi:centromeric protein E